MRAGEEMTGPDEMEMEPLHLWRAALADHVAGRRGTPLLLVEREGKTVTETFEQYFQECHELSPIDRKIVELARGRVLDVGAGAGRHAGPILAKGCAVVPIDSAPVAVELMRRRGLPARLADIWTFEDDEPFDTIMLAGHNVGMAGTLEGLERLLGRFVEMLAPGGQVLLDSYDLAPDQPRFDGHGRFLGEALLRLRYGDREGPEFPWLCVDFATLTELAGRLGWATERVAVEADGDYLARMTQG